MGRRAGGEGIGRGGGPGGAGDVECSGRRVQRGRSLRSRAPGARRPAGSRSSSPPRSAGAGTTDSAAVRGRSRRPSFPVAAPGRGQRSRGQGSVWPPAPGGIGGLGLGYVVSDGPGASWSPRWGSWARPRCLVLALLASVPVGGMAALVGWRAAGLAGGRGWCLAVAGARAGGRGLRHGAVGCSARVMRVVAAARVMVPPRITSTAHSGSPGAGTVGGGGGGPAGGSAAGGGGHRGGGAGGGAGRSRAVTPCLLRAGRAGGGRARRAGLGAAQRGVVGAPVGVAWRLGWNRRGPVVELGKPAGGEGEARGRDLGGA
jgi:hypothetical protein